MAFCCMFVQRRAKIMGGNSLIWVVFSQHLSGIVSAIHCIFSTCVDDGALERGRVNSISISKKQKYPTTALCMKYLHNYLLSESDFEFKANASTPSLDALIGPP